VVSVVFDFYGLSEAQDIAVENEQQYVDSRVRIGEAIHEESDLTVVVRNRRIANWYESLKDYSDSIVKVRSLSPKSMLAEKLGLPGSLSISLPLADGQIMRLNLLEKSTTFPPKSPLVTQRDVENWILSVCIDGCWSDSSTTVDHLSKLVSFFLSGNADLASQGGLEELVRKRKNEWIDSGLGNAYRWLLEEPAGNSFLVYSLQVLKGYEDSVRQRILTEIAGGKSLQPIVNYIDQIPSCECSDKIVNKIELSNLIELKWKNTLRDRLQYGLSELKEADKAKILAERFEQIVIESVANMSGRIVGEIDALIVFVQGNIRYFSERLFNLVGAKFHRFPQKVRELEDLIAPQVPSLPGQDWDWTRTSEWLIREYLPYANWLLRHVEEDKFLEDCAKAYGDWLYHGYPKMKNDLTPLNYGTWHVINNYLDDGYQVLWIIIDNLCWFHIEDVRAAFREKGFHPTSTGLVAQVSMLPSETRISKTALVAGKLPCQIDQDKFQKYAELFEQRCKESGIDSYRAMPDHELRTSRLGGHKITCCIINKLDVSSHQGFFDFEEDVKNLLNNVAKYLKSFIPTEVAAKKFRIVVSTDHGSCRIPNYVKGSVVPKTATMEGQHRRFIYVDSDEGLSRSWYFLDKDRFGLMRSMAIVKGYGFVGNKRPKGLIHGGMTPEETFIPLLEFCLEPLEIKGLRCIHVGAPIHLGPRKQRLELLVRNPNKSKVTGVHIFFPSHSVGIDLDEIPSNDERPVVVEVALRKEETSVTKENVATLTGYYMFDYQGERKSGEIQLEIRIRRVIDVSGTEERLLEF
jgi:hypothetical protein